jgi:FkbM family methyltransferase
LQILLGLIINPFALNKSRTLLRETSSKQISSILKSNDFSDNFQGITFYIDEKNSNNELINIFIKDNNGSLKTIISETNKDQDTTVYAKKGYVLKNKLILFNGTFQTLTEGNKIKNIDFLKADIEGGELNLLKGAEKTLQLHKPKIFIEIVDIHCSRFGHTQHDVIKFLINLNYKGFFMNNGLTKINLKKLQNGNYLFV